MKTLLTWLAGGLAAVLAGTLSAPIQASAQTVEEFYKDRTLTMIVPFAPGGISANFGQAVADHIGKYISGNPSIKAEFMPGGGGNLATNHVYNKMPRDGTSLLILDQAILTAPHVNPQGIEYDALKMNFIGVANNTTNVLMVRKDQNVANIEDLKTKEVFIASSGVGSETYTFPRLINGLLGTKMNVVAGFPGGAAEVLVAIESGEMHGSANSLATWLPRPDMVAMLNPIVVYGNGRTPHFPDTPNLLELVTDPTDQQVVRFLSAGNSIARSLATTPDVPADRLQALRRAFDRMVNDQGFIDAMKALKQDINSMTGEEAQAFVAEAVSVSPELVARTLELISVKQ